MEVVLLQEGLYNHARALSQICRPLSALIAVGSPDDCLMKTKMKRLMDTHKLRGISHNADPPRRSPRNLVTSAHNAKLHTPATAAAAHVSRVATSVSGAAFLDISVRVDP